MKMPEIKNGLPKNENPSAIAPIPMIAVISNVQDGKNTPHAIPRENPMERNSKASNRFINEISGRTENQEERLFRFLSGQPRRLGECHRPPASHTRSVSGGLFEETFLYKYRRSIPHKRKTILRFHPISPKP
jgi:hypothetical protein